MPSISPRSRPKRARSCRQHSAEPEAAPAWSPIGLTDESGRQLRRTLDDLVGQVGQLLGDTLYGVYLLGSFALGGADEFSDVDFLVLTAAEPDAPQVAQLRRLHHRLPDGPGPWAGHLEGSYVSLAQLRREPENGETWWYVDNGSRELTTDVHDNTWVTRWVLREHGIALLGADPHAVLDRVPASLLRAESRSGLTRWREFAIADPAALENAWLQQHAVLARCRCLYTVSTGKVGTKVAAGRWAARTVDQRWRPLIRQAIRDRPDPWQRVHRAVPPALAARTADFLTAG